jgi:hypothetical protein
MRAKESGLVIHNQQTNDRTNKRSRSLVYGFIYFPYNCIDLPEASALEAPLLGLFRRCYAAAAKYHVHEALPPATFLLRQKRSPLLQTATSASPLSWTRRVVAVVGRVFQKIARIARKSWAMHPAGQFEGILGLVLKSETSV